MRAAAVAVLTRPGVLLPRPPLGRLGVRMMPSGCSNSQLDSLLYRAAERPGLPISSAAPLSSSG